MATFTSKYDLGQTVWTISNSMTQRIVRCLTCEHTGEITVGGEKFVCPKCKGSSRHPQYAGHKWHVRETGVVGQVEVKATEDRHMPGWGEGKPVVTKYMIDSTGVGSGAIWEEDALYPSRSAADAECARRNADTNWADDA